MYLDRIYNQRAHQYYKHNFILLQILPHYLMTFILPLNNFKMHFYYSEYLSRKKSVHQKNKQRLEVFWMTIYIRLEI